jgi:hypothetical protein
MRASLDNSSLFGSSTDTDSNTDFGTEKDKPPKGLIILPSSLSPSQISSINSQISRNQNQTTFFKSIPKYLEIFFNIAFPFINKPPIFDQAVVNIYQKGDYLAWHVDLDKFEDGNPNP